MKTFRARIHNVLPCLLFSMIVSSGCATQYGTGWLPTSEQATHDGFGAYVHVEYTRGNFENEGELLAISSDTLYLASLSPIHFYSIPRDQVQSIKGNFFERKGVEIAYGWMLSAILFSPFTIGWFSFFSIPLYLITGFVAGNAASRMSRFSYDGVVHDWEQLRDYARFPQGLPHNFNRSKIVTRSGPRDEP